MFDTNLKKLSDTRGGVLPLLAAVFITAAWAPSQSRAATEAVLHNFGTPPKGARPLAGVVRDSAGNLYGTASSGGTAGAGVVFKVNTAGQETVVYSFSGGADGAFPEGGVVGDSSGNLYGTANSGGAGNVGVVFKINSLGQESVVYSFTGGGDGGYPLAGVILDSAGNLYGTTSSRGDFNAGVVFKVSASGRESVLYNFSGGTDGNYPSGGVVRDASGNLYGTTEYGGASGAGVVFKVSPSGAETVLYSFTGGADGDYPYAGLLRDASGNLYGTTIYGGAAFSGVVFKVTPGGQESVLHSFAGGSVDGANPYAGLIGDASGNLYGTTVYGGPQNAGVVFEINASSQETVLYGFTFGTPGQYPYSALYRDSSGNLYGTTSMGGPANTGVVFKLDSSLQETLFDAFPGSTDGYTPLAGVTADSAGNLYGTTYYGGVDGAGVVYKIAKNGEETTVHPFALAPDGGFPVGGVVFDSSGNLYGTTEWDGAAGYGTLYEVSASSQESVLYSFAVNAPGGFNPTGSLALDPAGNLYGTAAAGGTGAGVVFKLDRASGQESALYAFTGGADGNYPYAGVIRDPAGNLYGTTVYGGGNGAGVVFKIGTGGRQSVLYSFSGGADGGYPSGGVTLDASGNLYGTAGGGAFGEGVVFKVSPSGAETVLYTFTGGTDGSDPIGGVIRDPSGNLYGATGFGGERGAGTVFELTESGVESVLYSFTGGTDGNFPGAGVIRDSSGNLYGTTESGGSKSSGVVFEIKP